MGNDLDGDGGDKQGYNQNQSYNQSFNQQGCSNHGNQRCDQQGYNQQGYNRQGYYQNQNYNQSYNQQGYNRHGYNQNQNYNQSYNQQGYSNSGNQGYNQGLNHSENAGGGSISLSDLLKRRGCGVNVKTVSLMWYLLKEVSKFHAKEGKHGDIKSDCVIVGGDGTSVKLVKFNAEQYNAHPMTHINMAPEVLHDHLRTDTKIDIWSTGLLFYEMLSNGIHPFSGIDLENLLTLVDKSVERPSCLRCSSYASSSLNTSIPSLTSRRGLDALWCTISLMLQLNPKKRPSAEQAMCMEVFAVWGPPEAKSFINSRGRDLPSTNPSTTSYSSTGSSGSSTNTTSSTNSSSSTSSETEADAKILKLMEMGYKRNKVCRALELTNGDIVLAIELFLDADDDEPIDDVMDHISFTGG